MKIENEIRKFIEENFILEGDNHLGDEDSLLEKGIIDSTGVLELVAFLEETYQFKIKDEELVPENLDSIKNISQFVQNRLNVSLENVKRESRVARS
ncbi:MAG: acyl carrier protein [Thermodesulfobacteriota bacterium]